MDIVLASSNQGKLGEISAILSDLPITLHPQTDYNVPDADETGLTFIENAIIKARHAASIAQLPALADDSGLVVPALNGEPGIYSARYTGTPSNAQKNIIKLLEKLKDIPAEKRQAYFYCVIIFMRHANDPTPIISQGRWHGHILFEPRGEEGFGYDPIFYLDKQQCSAAELPSDEKNRLSHRAQALQQLREQKLF